MIFKCIPQDVTQWKIAPFLTPEERADFNSVLEQPERVYKKFPKDFAIKHSLRTYITAQKRHVERISYFMANSDIIKGQGEAARNTAMRVFEDYVDFISSHKARLIYQYKDKSKKSANHDLMVFLDGRDFPYRLYISQKLRDKLWDASIFVEDSVFIRDVMCGEPASVPTPPPRRPPPRD